MLLFFYKSTAISSNQYRLKFKMRSNETSFDLFLVHFQPKCVFIYLAIKGIAMLRFLKLFVFVCLLFGCESEKAVYPENISGDWVYVGTFDSRANYACYVCPDFKIEESIYKVTFKNEGFFNGRINLLIAEGLYAVSELKSEKNSLSGKISIDKLQIMNKPYETEADGKFQNLFQSSSAFMLNIGSDAESYDQLSLSNGSNDFLVFVRIKK
jgi:hypothetical protein